MSTMVNSLHQSSWEQDARPKSEASSSVYPGALSSGRDLPLPAIYLILLALGGRF